MTALIHPPTCLRVGLCCASLFGLARAPAAEAPAAVPIPPASNLVAKLRPGHPRLLALPADFERLRRGIGEDATLRAWHATLTNRAERMLGEPTSQYEIPDGLRLLSVSRRAVDRVYTLALLYRLGGDRRYAERAGRELEAAAAFQDWNPRHFLDTAEMTHAFAIGYDWLHDFWTPAQRDVLHTAMVEKGLRLGVECYRTNKTYGRWTKLRHNWNQVCNGGIGLGALALAEVEPSLAGEFLHAALQSLQLPMREFAPDGAWAEGPGYWNYATHYNVAFLAALRTALGTDFGLSDLPGFAEAGLFPIYMTGPLDRTFNYADGGEGAVRAPQMFWLARRFHQPAYAAHEMPLATPHALDLLWFDRETFERPSSPLALDRWFRAADIMSFRSAWGNRDAVFVGFKAGDNKANHSHLDLGTFVLDALGSRWAVDLGADDYNLPGYFGGQRWSYYRLRAEGHNTVVLDPADGPDQDPKAAGRITRFESKPDVAFAISDLTAAYASHARRVQRGVALLWRRDVLVQDELEAGQPADLWWFVHTPAAVSIREPGTTAVLSQNNQRLLARILPGDGLGRFQVMEAKPLPSSPKPDRQAGNERVRKLAVHLPGATRATIAIVFTPLREGEPEPTDRPALMSLDSWNVEPWPNVPR